MGFGGSNFGSTVSYIINRYTLVSAGTSSSIKAIIAIDIPYLLFSWMLRKAYAMTVGFGGCLPILDVTDKMIFDHEVAIVAIAKNEGLYIKEWIDFHRLVGISKIYLYDNEKH